MKLETKEGKIVRINFVLNITDNEYITFTVSVVSSRHSFERFSIQNRYSKHESLTELIGRIYPAQLLKVKSGNTVKIWLFGFQYNEINTRLFSSFSTLKFNFQNIEIMITQMYVDIHIK